MRVPGGCSRSESRQDSRPGSPLHSSSPPAGARAPPPVLALTLHPTQPLGSLGAQHSPPTVTPESSSALWVPRHHHRLPVPCSGRSCRESGRETPSHPAKPRSWARTATQKRQARTPGWEAGRLGGPEGAAEVSRVLKEADLGNGLWGEVRMVQAEAQPRRGAPGGRPRGWEAGCMSPPCLWGLCVSLRVSVTLRVSPRVAPRLLTLGP